MYSRTVGRIWTPNTQGEGLLELSISDQAKTSAEVTYDEMHDATAYARLSRADLAHQNTVTSLDFLRRTEDLKRNAIRLTNEAVARDRGEQPTMKEARVMEVACASASSGSEAATTEMLRDEAMEAHEKMMQAMLESANAEEDCNV